MAKIHLPSTSSVLSGERTSLRPPREGDKADRLACGRDPEFARMVGDELVALTVEEVDRWYDWLLARTLGWVIEVDGHAVGDARLDHFNLQDRRARYAIGIFDSELWGQGIGTEVTRLVLGYAFDELELHRVDLRVLEYNRRAIANYEKCGFVREGIERESAFINSEWHSDVIMGILEAEYRAMSKN